MKDQKMQEIDQEEKIREYKKDAQIPRFWIETLFYLFGAMAFFTYTWNSLPRLDATTPGQSWMGIGVIIIVGIVIYLIMKRDDKEKQEK